MPREPRRRWTPEEDEKLKRLKTDTSLSWAEIIQKGELPTNVQGASHRWENYVKSDFNKAGFSEEEDNIIIIVMSLSPDRSWRHWKFMANHLLPGRSPNDIKNYWNNHLEKKKRHETISDSIGEEDLKAWVVEALTTKVDPESPDEETSNHSVASTSDS